MRTMFHTLFLNFFGGPLLLPLVMAYLVAVAVAAVAVVRALVGTHDRRHGAHHDPS